MIVIALCLLTAALVAVLFAWQPMRVVAAAFVLVAVLGFASDALSRRGNGGRS